MTEKEHYELLKINLIHAHEGYIKTIKNASFENIESYTSSVSFSDNYIQTITCGIAMNDLVKTIMKNKKN